MSLLRVEDLHTHFISRDLDNQIQVAKALNGVSFSLDAGRILGLVGETGAGKSLTATSIMGLLRPPARIMGGRALFQGQDLLAMPDDDLNALRGRDIALVVQSPKSSLDPLSRIGDQLIRIRRAHRGGTASEAREKAIATLGALGIPDPARRMQAWPHELSGGMAQRVLIALALMNEPRLLIADEPTTGLDVTVQAQILDLLRDLVRRTGIAAMIITHDLGVVAHYCDEMAVMYAGAIVESGPVRQVFRRPAHPYTVNLIGATPERLRLGATRTVGGPPPNLKALPPGCPYQDRCPQAGADCTMVPPDVPLGEGHVARCHRVAA
ncbi:ABC transporter ATP-binding protein [Roseomonas stagni]|uniref:ABC transporter ATP-binding protein n=1 Tax=Falsiroseomonas algicola TaxID=2716930 RepID=A0A6M1LKC2_9PROT|nr:ABC transporter ATP-binding protein [Falsiroseomonas algicola]NGM20788.1 ABC transporter ATP-binding protein [Falsiroseomonas algicola]